MPLDADGLARQLDLPRVVLFDVVGSTLDVAHEMAASGAPAGTLIVADAQSAGRGRMGRAWTSEAGAGVWLTLVERPADARGLDVLSLRVGLALAPALDAFAPSPVRLKWPNDLYRDGKKLGGILVEARWREGAPDWVAIGVGINLRPPESEAGAIGLGETARRDAVLEAVVGPLRSAAAASGPLSQTELDEFARRDCGVGRRCTGPVEGVVRGIDASGSLLVRVTSADIVAVRAGSLVFEDDQ